MLEVNERTGIFPALAHAISSRSAMIGVIGLGYIGLPLAAATARSGFQTIGFDIDPEKIGQLNRGCSYIDSVGSEQLLELVREQRFTATSNFSELAACDVIIICVPTPLTRYREPDLFYVESTGRAIARHLRAGQLIVLESTSFPGTTSEVLKPILEESGLRAGVDFYLGFSPERVDPGNQHFATIPKVVSGEGAQASEVVESFYRGVVTTVVPVSSPTVAEAVKITENIFRAVNIALVNELKVIYDAMGVDIWEVIDAAATKPFGFMPFYPGPGLGGHCIPIDPFYLTWRLRAYGFPTRFIELAGEINLAMPHYVARKLEEGLDRRLSVPLSKARVLVLGLAYKKNVADIRESPALKLIDILLQRGARVDYHDPHVPEIPPTREYAELRGRRSIALDRATLQACDAVLVVTDHDAVDYRLIVEHARLVVDTRNVLARQGVAADHIIKA
jgi:UDP-N-acetyl-D-glucosamine dehydrogenase